MRAPYPGFIEPCQATQRKRPPEDGAWIHEIKHDGYRAQAHVTRGTTALYTRRAYDWSEKFSSIAEQLKQLPYSELILDGEIVVQNERGISDFHELQKDIAAGRRDRMVYMVFDLLYVDGLDLRGVSLSSRRKVLTQLLASSSAARRIRLSEHIEADGHAVFEQACAMALEGIVSKHRDSPYRSGEQDGLTLVVMFAFRRFMAQHSIVYIVGLLTVIGTVLSLPNIAMFYGLHHWTAAHTNGVVDARFIALIDTALESPLGQVPMIPLLAWIADCAPEQLKATYFAVMTSFINLAVSMSQLLTKYVNQIFRVTREVRDPVTGVVQVPADYSQMGYLFIAVTAFSLIVPLIAILFVKFTRFKSE